MCSTLKCTHKNSQTIAKIHNHKKLPKDCKTDICCFSPKYVALRSKRKVWLTWDQESRGEE